MRRQCLLALVTSLACVVQAHAGIPLPGGIALAIRVPMEVFIIILAVVVAAAVIMWSIVGIMHLVRRRRTRAQLTLTRKDTAQEFQKDLPWKIDPMTTLTDVAADGVVLTCTFTVDASGADVTPSFLDATKKASARMMFQREGILHNLKLGAIYRYRYIDLQGKLLGTLDLTAADFA